jgi:hypothetical protein
MPPKPDFRRAYDFDVPALSSKGNILIDGLVRGRLIESKPPTLRYENGERLPLDGRIVVFPLTLVASITRSTQDGAQCSVAMVGREGAVGLMPLFGLPTHNVECHVSIPGTAVQIQGQQVQALLARPEIREMLSRYVAFRVESVYISAVCNRLHGLPGRMATWLLLADDRRAPELITITHEALAGVLGAHRPSVTLVARELERRGLVEHRRVVLRIADRRGLAEMACECFELHRANIRRYGREVN